MEIILENKNEVMNFFSMSGEGNYIIIILKVVNVINKVILL